MTLGPIYPGAQLKYAVKCRVADVLTDPTSLEVRIKPPTGDEVTYTWPADAAVVRDANGIFHVLVAVTDDPGIWTVRSKATGAVVDATESTFQCKESAFSEP